MDTQIEQTKFICEKCNFTCNKKYNYHRHFETSKHKNAHILDTKIEQKEPEQTISNKVFACVCGKQYKYSQGLSKHKKMCIKKDKLIMLLLCSIIKK